MNNDNDDDMMLDAAGAFVDSKGGSGGCGGGGGAARGLTNPSTLVSNAPPSPLISQRRSSLGNCSVRVSSKYCGLRHDATIVWSRSRRSLLLLRRNCVVLQCRGLKPKIIRVAPNNHRGQLPEQVTFRPTIHNVYMHIYIYIHMYIYMYIYLI